MQAQQRLRTHSIPIALVPSNDHESEGMHNASATLLWVDRPFAVTVAHVLRRYLERLREDPRAEVWLGGMRIHDLADRVLCLSDRHDLATLRVEPDELPDLGEDWTFHNPEQWPAPAVDTNDRVIVYGYPRDQWPAQVSYEFRVETAQERRFTAILDHASMPGRLAGLCGGPVFRVSPRAEFVGVVTEALFHNEVIRCQHAHHVDPCGQVNGLAAGDDH